LPAHLTPTKDIMRPYATDRRRQCATDRRRQYATPETTLDTISLDTRKRRRQGSRQETKAGQQTGDEGRAADRRRRQGRRQSLDVYTTNPSMSSPGSATFIRPSIRPQSYTATTSEHHIHERHHHARRQTPQAMSRKMQTQHRIQYTSIQHEMPPTEAR
jgi:hypothetical protein